MATQIERTVLGIDSPPLYEGIPLFGLCNHPCRTTHAFRKSEHPANALYHELNIAEATLLEKGLGNSFFVLLSQDWVRHGVKPQNIESFCIHSAVLSPLLPKGTAILCDRTARTIRIGVGLWMTLMQSYPKAGESGVNRDNVLFTIASCIVPMIRSEHCGIMHLRMIGE